MKKNILALSGLLILSMQSFTQDSLVIKLQGDGVKGFTDSIVLTETNQEFMGRTR